MSTSKVYSEYSEASKKSISSFGITLQCKSKANKIMKNAETQNKSNEGMMKLNGPNQIVYNATVQDSGIKMGLLNNLADFS